MIGLRTVAEVRAAEERAMAVLPDGTLMQRAATGLAVTCLDMLGDSRGGVTGARVVLLVGTGSNGGDALWAGALLARRGCAVTALTTGERWHAEGAAALVAAGGRLRAAGDASSPATADLVSRADLVVDGILGIGGSGGLRPPADALADLVRRGQAPVVAVDLPSGVDADTGAVAGAVVSADVTVTFGAVTPGLVLSPGLLHAGDLRLVDIDLSFDEQAAARCLEGADAAAWVPEPEEDAYKYRRGVVGVAAGSASYPGAADLATAAARHGGVGMTRVLDRGDGVAAGVVARFPDVVVDGSPPAEQSRADAWACGPGFPGDETDRLTVDAVLDARVPVVLDAGALTVLAQQPALLARVAERRDAGLATVLTPHEGEFERMFPGVLAAAPGRREAALAAAGRSGAIVVLKGPGTVVAEPSGACWIDVEGTADLATAGSGDVLTGLVGALLAVARARSLAAGDELAEAVAAAVWLHGRAGRLASARGPVVATDIADAVHQAVADARSAGHEDAAGASR